jgi:regulator of cell morphogenesis and NO signaling
MITMQPNATLADLATAHPAASRVFHRLGLDYCCGGRRTLDAACREQGLVPAEVLDAITRETPESQTDEASWNERPLDELVAFIVNRYHQALRRELPELVALAAKVEDRHAGKAGVPAGLADHLRLVHAAVLEHLEKEERILFPMILAGRGGNAAGPVQVMEHEHRDHGANLARIRELAGDFTPPEAACTSWRALYLRLHALEGELMEHIHLENNVLFPRALRG